MRKIFFLMLACLLLAAAQPVFAETPPPPVKVGYFENEIFQEGAEKGAIRRGYAYEYYRKLSEYTGWEYEYVYGSFSELYQMLLDGKVDLLAGLAKTEERQGVIGYPEAPMGSETYNMVKHRADDSITTTFSTLSGKKIGVLDSAMVGALQRFLAQQAISAEVVTYPTHQELLDDFDENKIDALVAESDGTYDRPNAALLYPFGSTDYYLCVNSRRPDLLAALNQAQNQLAVEEPNYINSLRIKYYASSIASRALSDAEKEWLKEHRALRMGYLNHYLPYSDTDADGAVTGLVQALVPQILEELGVNSLNISYQGYDSYTAMIADVDGGKIDAAFPVGGGLFFSEESGICPSNPVVSSATDLIFKGDYSDKTLAAFAVNENNRMQYYYVKTHFPNARILFFPSIEDCLDAVLEGKASCATLNGLRANDILKNRRFRGLSIKQSNRPDDRSFGVRIGNEGLLKLLNRGVNIIGKDRMESLAYWYVDGLHTQSMLDVLMDNLWLLALAAAVVSLLVAAFLARESAQAKRHKEELIISNERLAAAAREAESANQAKTYFLSTMSHDIRTPMNSILSMNEMVLRESDNEDILRYSQYIRSSGNTLLGLINDILDFSKMEAGKLDIIPVDYEISSVLNDLVNMTKTKADEKGLQLRLNIDSDMPNSLRGDEIRIKQAVTNILTNAVKYTKEGTVTFSIGYDKIPEDPDAILLKISVADTGVGIKQEDIGKMFDAFQRIDETNNHNIEGTGLGITITQSLLQLMGSRLEVESEYGKGSVFRFAVRQQVVKWDKVGDYEAAFRRSIAERKRYAQKFTAPDAHILVVDDTPVNLIVFKSLLKHTKVQIDTADSADECIALSSRQKYDVIFLDHMMPYKDGIEAMQELKSAKGNPNTSTPMVCLTANAISGMRETYLTAGFDDYLTKPIDPDSLEETIIRYLPKEKLMSAEESDREPEGTLPPFLYGIDGLDVSKGLEHIGSTEAYLETATSYAETAAHTADEIERYWTAGDLENTTIKVHGLKSSSKVIGAMELGLLAESLEKAGRAGDTEPLRANIDRLLADYRRLGKELAPLLHPKEDAAEEKPPMSEEKLREIYQSLKDYAEAFDYDKMEEAGNLLGEYSVPESERERAAAIRKAIADFDYDDVPKLLEGSSLLA